MDQVTRFRLFRSRVFWFGVVGLVFLLWAWRISFVHHTELGSGVERRWGITLHAGEVAVYWNSEQFPDWKGQFDWETLLIWSEKRSMDEGWARWMAAWRELVPGFHYVRVAHSLIVSGYCLIWAMLMGWRVRMFRRAASKRPPDDRGAAAFGLRR